METVITCPNCKTEIPLSDAFKHEIEAGVLATERARHQRELEAATKAIEIAAIKKATDDAAQREAALRAEAAEEKERNRKLLTQLEEMTTELRSLRRKDEEREFAYKQQLAAEEERIRAEARKNADDEYALKLREREKQLADTREKLKEVEAKMQQGSQQAQGEVLELEIEELLREAFRDDTISEVKKGRHGADITETVIDRRGRKCGTILWETKNGKWQEAWLAKLRDDQREAKAELAVLVIAQPPADIETFAHRDGVWIVHRRSARDLASLLRFSLIQVFAERTNQAGKDEKMEVLYGYLTSIDFQHRIQAIVEGFGNLLDGIEQEKRQFGRKWAQQEKELRRIIDNTAGMYGELQAVTG